MKTWPKIIHVLGGAIFLWGTMVILAENSTEPAPVAHVQGDEPAPDSAVRICGIQHSEQTSGTNSLTVSIAALPSADIRPDNPTIYFYIYERSEKSRWMITKVPVKTEWMDLPFDWADTGKETVGVTFTIPADTHGGTGPRWGYVIGLYYDGKLVQTCSDPKSIVREFPLNSQIAHHPE